MKTPSTELFDLIRSMSGSEKRFFKLYASSQGSDKNYLKLFDATGKQASYDEAAIKRMFPGESFIRRLSFTKEYLYNAVLKSLSAYHAGLSADARIMQAISDARVLFRKALFRQCLRKIRQARELAAIHEKYPLLLEALDIEKKLYIRQPLLATSEKRLAAIMEEELDSAAKLSNLSKYWNLNSVMQRNSSRNWRPRMDDDLRPFRDIMRHPLMKGVETPACFESLFYDRHIRGMYCFFERDPGTAYRYLREAVELLESRPAYIRENPQRYFLARANVILARLHAGKYEEALALLYELKQEFTGKKMTPDMEARVFSLYYIYRTNISLNIGDFGKALSEEMRVREGMEKFGDLLQDESAMVLCFNYSVLHFMTGNCRRSLQWLNRIYLLGTGDQVRVDLLCFVRIFEIVIHFELGNHEVLNYKVKSVYRYLAKKERLYRFENVVIDFIREYSNTHFCKKDEVDLFKRFRKRLEKLLEDPFEREALERFDFLAWIDSKIRNRPFEDIIRAKLQKGRSERAG